jgi:hypothetical protein
MGTLCPLNVSNEGKVVPTTEILFSISDSHVLRRPRQPRVEWYLVLRLKMLIRNTLGKIPTRRPHLT